MFKKVLYIIGLALISGLSTSAQSAMEEVLSAIATNNKTLKAQEQFWEARRLSYGTGITPDNPTIAYEYMVGSPAGAGNQQDFFVLQALDFPTAYVKKKQVSQHQVAQDKFIQTGNKQNLMLTAKRYCIELVYLNKTKQVLARRLKRVQQLSDDFKKRLASGDVTALEVSRAKVELLEVQKSVRLNERNINFNKEKLVELNGGVPLDFTDTTYSVLPVIPEFEVLKQRIEENDPIVKSLEEQRNIDEKKLELSKALALPRIEGGYHSQAILGQSYKGVHVGMTIPLWESKNTVKHQKAHLLYNELEVEDHKNHHHYETNHLYENYQSLKTILEEYQSLLATLNVQQLLNKSLTLGEISSSQYFLEMSYYYAIYDEFSEVERDYNLVVSELFKYEL